MLRMNATKVMMLIEEAKCQDIQNAVIFLSRKVLYFFILLQSF